MKAKYNATSNCLEELATIGKPPILFEEFIEGTTEWLAMKIRWDEYSAHLASLRRIPCHPSCVGKWSDGQILTEDVDYVVGDYPVKAMMSNDPKHLAFPLPVKSEGSWKDLFHKIWGDNKDGIYNKKDWQLLLQKLEIITKK